MDERTWDNLKSACRNGSPAGENCEYQPAFLELLKLATPRPEIQMGSAVIAARLPDWPAILEQSLQLAERTRDLRIGAILTESLAQIDGWSGLAAGLEVLEYWTINLWGDVFPELDHEEQDDPTARLSALAHMLSDQFTQRTLYQFPLADHPALGTLRLRDTLTIVKGKKEVARELTSAELAAFFNESEPLALAMRLRDVDRCCTAIAAIDDFLNSQPGSADWSAARLLQLLQRGRDLLLSNLTHHQSFEELDAHVAPTPSAATAEVAVSATTNDQSANQSANQPADDSFPLQVYQNKDDVSAALESAVTSASICPLQIRSRNDATTAIDAVCAYFQIHEPASPVPLLLQRANRLVSMNFIELMHELAPNEAMQLLRQLHVVERAG